MKIESWKIDFAWVRVKLVIIFVKSVSKSKLNWAKLQVKSRSINFIVGFNDVFSKPQFSGHYIVKICVFAESWILDRFWFLNVNENLPKNRIFCFYRFWIIFWLQSIVKKKIFENKKIVFWFFYLHCVKFEGALGALFNFEFLFALSSECVVFIRKVYKHWQQFTCTFG